MLLVSVEIGTIGAARMTDDIQKMVNVAVNDALAGIRDFVNKEIEEIHEIVTNVEQISANLLTGYQEQAIGLEVVMEELASGSTEKASELKRKIEDGRKLVLDALTTLSQDPASPYSDVAESFRDLFQSSDTVS